MDDTRRPDHNIHAYSYEYKDDNNNYDDDDDIVPGFRINASSEYHNSRRNNHVGVFDNDEEDDDDNDGDYDRRRTFHPRSSSSDDDDINCSDVDEITGDGSNFTTFGRTKTKRRRRQQTDDCNDGKERNLYGVFYEDSSNDDVRQHRSGSGAKGRGKGGSNDSKGASKSRSYDTDKNRMAGLAFVKAASVDSSSLTPNNNTNECHDSNNTTNNNDATKQEQWTEFKINDKRKLVDGINGKILDNIPSWLRGVDTLTNPLDGKTKVLDHKAEMDISANSDAIDDENDDANGDDGGESTLITIREREAQFHKLLEIATSKTTTSTSSHVDVVEEQALVGNYIAGKSPMESKIDDYADEHLYLGAEDNAGRGLGFENRSILNERIGILSSSSSSGIGLVSRDNKNITDDIGSGARLGMSSTDVSGGLGGGLGSEFTQSDHTSSSFYEMSAMMGGGIGLGFGSVGQQVPPKSKDPNLGKWEKHTKGIGMKLLQKMGYQGSGGLGAKRRRPVGGAEDVKVKSETEVGVIDKEDVKIKKGISRPVEVVVRPNGLGLGFGNFRESTQLKSNRRIEAEVRGIELPNDEENKKMKVESSVYDGIDKSLLPSTDSILKGGKASWRRGNKKPKRKIVHYQDILDKSTSAGGDGSTKMKIIDMRGSAINLMKEDGGKKKDGRAVLIGEELLHNVTLVLNTNESQLRTASFMVQSTERKIANLEDECKEMIDRKETLKNRCDKMKLALSVIGEVDKLLDDFTTKKRGRQMSFNEELDFVLNSLETILTNLYSNFSREDRTSLKFESTLIPSIVIPLFDTLLTSSLNPLQMNHAWMDHLGSGIRKLCDMIDSSDETQTLREIVIIQGVLPSIQSSLNSSKWDPVRNVDSGIGVYEALVSCANKSLRSGEEADQLRESIIDGLIRTAVLPKLLRAVEDWRPKFEHTHEMNHPLHFWIMPWLPYISNNTMLGTLLDNVRRNLTKLLSFYGKTLSNDIDFFRACLAALSPWKKLFDKITFFQLTSLSVTPRFARSLARIKICIDPTEQDWEHLYNLFVYFEGGVMSVDDFISLVQGEVLPAWAHALYNALQQPSHDIVAIKNYYSEWRQRFFQPWPNVDSGRTSYHDLRLDSLVCRYFYGGLSMIQATLESNVQLFDVLRPPLPKDCNYKISLMNQSKERVTSDGPRDTNIRVCRTKYGCNRTEASFQSVVEAFANQNNITFYPKTGSNSMIDGKPVYLFGNHQVYVDKNVLYTLRESKWQPIALEQLLSCSDVN